MGLRKSDEQKPLLKGKLKGGKKLDHTAFLDGLWSCGFVSWPEPWQVSDSEFFEPYLDETGRRTFIGIRTLFLIWGFGTILFSLATNSTEYSFWLCKLAGWSFSLTVMYFAFATYYTYKDTKDVPRAGSIGRQFTVFLFATAFSTSFCVTVLYWTMIFGHESESRTAANTVSAFHLHFLSLVWLIIDLALNKLEFRHTLSILVAGFTFLVFFINGIWQQQVNSKKGMGAYNTYSGATFFLVLALTTCGFYVGHLMSLLNLKHRRKRSFFLSQKTLRDVVEDMDDDYEIKDFDGYQVQHRLTMDERSASLSQSYGGFDSDRKYTVETSYAVSINRDNLQEQKYEDDSTAVWRQSRIPDEVANILLDPPTDSELTYPQEEKYQSNTNSMTSQTSDKFSESDYSPRQNRVRFGQIEYEARE